MQLLVQLFTDKNKSYVSEEKKWLNTATGEVIRFSLWVNVASYNFPHVSTADMTYLFLMTT